MLSSNIEAVRHFFQVEGRGSQVEGGGEGMG